jgi:hypothetical protein
MLSMSGEMRVTNVGDALLETKSILILTKINYSLVG